MMITKNGWHPREVGESVQVQLSPANMVHGLRSCQVCTQGPARIIYQSKISQHSPFLLRQSLRTLSYWHVVRFCMVVHITSHIEVSKPQSPEPDLFILRLEYHLKFNQVGREGFFYTDSGTIEFIHLKDTLYLTTINSRLMKYLSQNQTK